MKQSISPWVVGIFVFFGVIISANVYVYFVSTASFNGLITENPYQAGIEYQSVIDVLEKTAQDNVLASLEFSGSDADGTRAVTATLRTSTGEVLSGYSVTLLATRPSDASLDVQGVLGEHAPGSGEYGQVLSLPKKGLWLVEVRASKDETHYAWKFREFLS